MQAYSSLLSEKVSPAGISDVEEDEGGEEEGGLEEEGGREEEEERGVEEEGGEAVDVMMERRETVDEGTTGEGVVRVFAFL